MGESIEISVILATRNRSRYLPDVLGSLTQQRCEQAFEVVVVNNGSTDGTEELLDAWCRRNPRFTAIVEDRLGTSVAVNTGIRAARGRLLLFTDDDVLVDPGWVQAWWRFLSAHGDPTMVAGGRILAVPDDLGPWPPWFDEGAMVELPVVDRGGERRLSPAEYVWGANMAALRVVFDRVGPWDETLGPRGDQRGTHQDVELQDRVRSAGGEVWFSPGPLVHHRVPRTQVTTRRVLSAAFTRGAADRMRLLAGAAPHGTEALRETQTRRGLVLRLAAALAAWTVRTVAFRVSGGPSAFRRARLAAWRSGWLMARVIIDEDGSEPRWPDRVAGWRGVTRRVAMGVGRRNLRLVRDQ